MSPAGDSLTLPVHFALPARSKDQVPLVHDADLEAATLTWKFSPHETRLVVIAKATFDLVHGGVAEPSEESVPLAGDEPFAEGSSLRTSSDFVPFKPKVDVTMTGFAYAAEDEPVRRVALTVGDAQLAVAALGDRTWNGDGASAPGRFERIPLTWEHAYGGVGFAVNPVGRGFGQRLLPNLEDPAALIRTPNDVPSPVSFGPRAGDWEPRRSLLGGTYDAAWLEAGWPYFPADFDWSYFNSAPPALQASRIAGNEPYELVGVHPSPEHASIRGHLPGVTIRAVAVGPCDEGSRLTDIPLRIDTVRFDAEALTVSLTWRGALAVSGVTAPELERVFLLREPLGSATPLTELVGELTRVIVDRYGAEAVPVTKQALDAAREPRALGVAAPPSIDAAAAAAFVAERASLAGADLTGFDLRQLDLRGKDLRGARFVDAWLHGANLEGADLRGALLLRARGLETNFRAANLEGANVAEAVLPSCDFSTANLGFVSGAEAHLEGCSFEGATLDRANLTEVNARRSRFDRATLHGAVLSGAWLEGATFRGASLDDAELHDVYAEGVSFSGVSARRLRADGARLAHADFARALADDASFDASVLAGARFTEATLDGAVFAHADLTGADLARSSAKGTRFRHALLSDTALTHANLMEARFDHAVLRRVDLSDANLFGVDTEGACLEQVKLDGARVAGSRFGVGTGKAERQP